MNQSMPELPRYQLLAEVGRGTTGIVYRARDLRLDRVVAMKVPFAQAGERNMLARFIYEVGLLAGLTGTADSCIPALHLAAEFQGRPYYIRDFVDGETLERRVVERSIASPAGIRVLAEVAGAVARLHSLGIVHGNLNPSNVLVALDGSPKLIGFGRARVRARAVQLAHGTPSASSAWDVADLEAMLDWLFVELDDSFPHWWKDARDSVPDAAVFAALLHRRIGSHGGNKSER